MNWLRGTKGALLVAAMTAMGTTCTLLIDHSKVQCRNDADCVHFGYHPSCQNSFCVSLRNQPKDCFPISPPNFVPTIQSQFLNACSPNAMLPNSDTPIEGCLSFTNPIDAGGIVVPPTTPTTASVAPTVPTSQCKEMLLPGKSILYMTGSSNFPPLLQELARVIVNTSNIVPVFRTSTSCGGVRSMNSGSATYNADHYIKDPTTANDTYAQIFLGDGNPPVSCLLGSSGVPIDVGESEIAQETCGPPSNPTDTVSESLGPILPIIFVVPKLSSEKVISTTAAQLVFGGSKAVSPWVDPTFMYIRGQGTATLRLVGKQIGLQPGQFWGTDQGNALAMANNLAVITNQQDANSAIGMIGTDYYDQPQFRGSLKALGLQVSDQECAYLPDSTLTSHDKINVRDGHYPLWGRIHFFAARVNGVLSSQPARDFLSVFTGATLDDNILTALINAGFVPPCAMKVTRATELGDFTYDDPPPVSCGCAFDAQVSSVVRPECKACPNGSADCPLDRPACNNGFCEVQ
jgi:hypothetical protein